MTAEVSAVAIIAAINAQLGAAGAAYDIDEIPGKKGSGGSVNPGTTPSRYVEVGVSRRYGGNARGGGSVATQTLYRATTRAVALSVTDARNLRRITTVALEDKELTVLGLSTTPVQFETETQIAPDEGWFSGLSYWTFSL